MPQERRFVLDSLRKVVALGRGAWLTDAQLLERFISQGDQAAFEVLAWRHSGLVFSACRRVLRDAEDLEDAFQATFLVFARKAHSIRRPEILGSWLYRVAYRMALRARSVAARRAAMEKQGSDIAANEPAYEPPSPELRVILDEELDRLPEKYRLPLVLCYLEGMTKEEAAGRLGCPSGTISSRLTRGRERLRVRLARRGLALTTAALIVALEQNAVLALPPAHLVQSTVKAILLFAAGNPATAGFSAGAFALTKGALRAMFLAKLKLCTVFVLAVGTLGSGAGLWFHRSLAANVAQGIEPIVQPGALAQIEEQQNAEIRGESKELDSDPTPPTGRTWEVAPRTVNAGKRDANGYFTSDTVLGIYCKDSTGGLVLTLSYPIRDGQANVARYRPVAFAGDGKVYSFEERWTAFNKQIASYQYRLDPTAVPLDGITQIGIEKVK